VILSGPAIPSGRPSPKECAMSRMCISELMHSCTSATVQSDTTLRDAAERVLATGLESLPVVDASGRFVGLVVQAALIRELLSCSSRHAVVAPIVSHHVESARSTAALDSVLPLFRSAGIAMIPVVDEDDCPVGLIHRRDVIRYLLDDSPTEAEQDRTSHGPAASPYFLRKVRKSSDC
jgi:CBS-domain-containing membrane protein